MAVAVFEDVGVSLFVAPAVFGLALCILESMFSCVVVFCVTFCGGRPQLFGTLEIHSWWETPVFAVLGDI